MAEHSVSTILLTYDSYSRKYGCVEHALLSVLSQHNINQEIILVDNGKKPDDSRKLKNFIASLKNGADIKLLTGNTSVAQARNRGAAEAKNEVIIFIDEDTLLLEDQALLKIAKAADSHVYGYGAKRDWTPPGEWFLENAEQLKLDLRNNDYDFLKRNVSPPDPAIRRKSNDKYLIRSFIGNFGFVQNDIFQKIGGFPKQFDGYGLEDDAISFLLYHRLGAPSSLSNIHIAHVNHPIEEEHLLDPTCTHL